MGRKVYAVRWWQGDWQVCEAEVESETATTLTLASTGTALGGFGYRRQHPLDAFATTPAEAIARKLAEESAAVKQMVADIAERHERIRRLAVLGARAVAGGE